MIALAEDRAARGPDRIGVALSAGSAAAMAEIGALEVLSEAGLSIDCVAGTSAGAIVGAAQAAGRLSGLRAALEQASPKRVMGLFDPVWPRSGLIEGIRGLDWIRPFLGDRIETLEADYAAVATDLRTGEGVVLTTGPVADAVRASIAFPGIFTPWEVDGRLLVDGGLVDPLPVGVVRELGADFVIAINVLPIREPAALRAGPPCPPLRLVGDEPEPSVSEDAAALRESVGLLGVLARSSRIVAAELASHSLRASPPDLLIRIPLPEVGMFDLHRTQELVEYGRRAARAALPALRRRLDVRAGVGGVPTPGGLGCATAAGVESAGARVLTLPVEPR